MTKRNLVVNIANEIGVTQNTVRVIVEKVLEGITNALASGDKIEFRNFGVLKVKSRGARVGRNPRTGKVVSIVARKVISFKAGKILKKKVEQS